MYKLIIFGGTSEGRALHDFAREKGIPSLTCVATEYGAEQLTGGEVYTGRLDSGEMAALINREKPVLVIDATHPYAEIVSLNIKSACEKTGIWLLRVSRERGGSQGFEKLDDLIEKLKTTRGDVFVTLGVKEAGTLTNLPDFEKRLWLRILPSAEGLQECLSLGYEARKIICMQGPFSRELNLAMFRDTGCRILVTKDSGAAGGFCEKISAAQELDMEILLLSRPYEEACGTCLDDAKEIIARL